MSTKRLARISAIQCAIAQPACVCIRRHFGQHCASLPACCSYNASLKVRIHHMVQWMSAPADPRGQQLFAKSPRLHAHTACRAFNVPRQAGRAAFVRQAVPNIPSWPAVQRPMPHSVVQDEQHAAVLAAVLQPGTTLPPAPTSHELSRPFAMQQPTAAGPAAVEGSGAAAAATQSLSRDRLTVEVPKAAPPDAPAATQAVDSPMHLAVRSPGGQQWSDPLQTVCPLWR